MASAGALRALAVFWSLKQAFSQATIDLNQLQNIDCASGFRGELAPFRSVTSADCNVILLLQC